MSQHGEHRITVASSVHQRISDAYGGLPRLFAIRAEPGNAARKGPIAA